MRNMQATSQGGGTGKTAGDSFKNMEQSMEQNGYHNRENSNNTQQMEENLKGASGMRTGKEILLTRCHKALKMRCNQNK